MDELTASGLLEVSGALVSVCTELGMVVPSFRCPPRSPGVERSIRRWAGGGAVAVVRRGRDASAVIDDLVEGAVVLSHLSGDPAAAARSRLRAAAWAAIRETTGRALASTTAGVVVPMPIPPRARRSAA